MKDEFNGLIYLQPAEALTKKHPALTEDAMKQWLLAAKEIANRYSKDPSTKTCSLIITPQNELLAVGINSFPEGVTATPERLADRDLKYPLTLHSERSAITACAKKGIATEGNIIVTLLYPCDDCTKDILGAGLSDFVTDKAQINPGILERWKKQFEITKILLQEGGKTGFVASAITVTETDRLHLDIDRIPGLDHMVTGVALSAPLLYEDLDLTSRCKNRGRSHQADPPRQPGP